MKKAHGYGRAILRSADSPRYGALKAAKRPLPRRRWASSAMPAVSPALSRPISGLNLDVLQRRVKQVTLFLPAPALERAKVEQRRYNRQASEPKASQPVNQPPESAEASDERRLTSNQHCQRSNQSQGAKPAPARSSIESHCSKLSSRAARRTAQTAFSHLALRCESVTLGAQQQTGCSLKPGKDLCTSRNNSPSFWTTGPAC